MSHRRLVASASTVAASLRRLRASASAHAAPAGPAAPAASGLATCVLCGRDFVTPVDWEPVGEDRWWIFLRCAECGTSREVTVSNAVAERYDRELGRGAQVIERAAAQLEQARLAAEAESFLAALRDGRIEPADFAA